MAGTVEFRRQTTIEKIEPEPEPIVYNIDFSTYADGNLDGQSYWTQGSGHFTVNNGLVYAAGVQYTIWAVYEQPLGDDQYSEIVIVSRTVDNPSNSLGPAVRMSSNSGYMFVTSHEDLAVVRLNGESSTVLDRPDGAIDEGDVVRISAEGNVITCYINNNIIWQGTDNTYSSGYTGFGGYSGLQWSPFTSTETLEIGEL